MAAITFPITVPHDTKFDMIELNPVSRVAMAQNPFTGQQWVQRYPGQFWMVQARVGPMSRMSAQAWFSWLASLNGQEGTFLMGLADSAVSRGSAGSAPGSPVISGAGQSGDTLVISGAPSNASNYLVAGDYLSVGSGSTTHLHMVLANVTANSAGICSIAVWPWVRSDMVNGSAVRVNSAQGLWRLVSNELGWTVTPGPLYAMQFGAMEVL